MTFDRSAASRAAGALPGLAALALTLLAAHWQADRGQAPATAWLGLSIAAVTIPLGLAARRELRTVAAVALLAPLAAIYLPRQGALPLAAVATLLAVAVVAVGLDRLERVEPRVAVGLGGWFALSTAAIGVTGFGRLWTEGERSGALLELVAQAAVAALVLATSERQSRGPLAPTAGALVAAGAGAPWPALAIGVVALAAGHWLPATARFVPPLVASAAFVREPAWVASTLVVLALVAAFEHGALVRVARGALALAALAALLVAAPPWLRAAPLESALTALARPPSPRAPRELLGHRALVIAEAGRAVELALRGEAIGAVVVDGHLSDAVELPCGTGALDLELRDAAGRRVRTTLRIGPQLGEWAADRAALRPALGCADAPPFARWIAPGERLLGRSYRARIELPAGFAPVVLTLGLEPALRPGVVVTATRIALER